MKNIILKDALFYDVVIANRAVGRTEVSSLWFVTSKGYYRCRGTPNPDLRYGYYFASSANYKARRGRHINSVQYTEPKVTSHERVFQDVLIHLNQSRLRFRFLRSDKEVRGDIIEVEEVTRLPYNPVPLWQFLEDTKHGSR